MSSKLSSKLFSNSISSDMCEFLKNFEWYLVKKLFIICCLISGDKSLYLSNNISFNTWWNVSKFVVSINSNTICERKF